MTFTASGTLPKRVDDFFIKAIQALLKGFEPCGSGCKRFDGQADEAAADG